jgi:hypothetical protein
MIVGLAISGQRLQIEHGQQPHCMQFGRHAPPLIDGILAEKCGRVGGLSGTGGSGSGRIACWVAA